MFCAPYLLGASDHLPPASRNPHHIQGLWTVPWHAAVKPKVHKYRYWSWKPVRFYQPPDHTSCIAILHKIVNAWWSDPNAKEENSPTLHQRCSEYRITSAENSPLKPKPSVWRSSVGDKVHFGCRPCCAEALSAPHRGYSLWTPSQKQSAVKSKPRVAWAKINLLCVFSCVWERDNNSALAWRNYPLCWACKTVTSLNQPSTPRYWKPDPCANAGGTLMLSTHWGSDFWGPCSTRGKVCSWLLGALFRCKVQPLGFLGLSVAQRWIWSACYRLLPVRAQVSFVQKAGDKTAMCPHSPMGSEEIAGLCTQTTEPRSFPAPCKVSTDTRGWPGT